MKIYHTETQADYDALMVELERQGCKWASGDEMTELAKNWKRNSSETCVRVDKKVVAYDKKSYYKEDYPTVPIIKYKAKADEKMKFTKENIYKMVERYRSDFDYLIGDLKSDIFNLDDTPEKVVVPKFVAEWIEWNKQMGVRLKNLLKCYADFCRGEEPNVSSEWLKAVRWYVDNPYKFIQAYENGYTIEPEKLYYIPLPHLETSDGIQQVLSKRDTYFASRPNEKLKQRYTKEELEQVPEVYKFYAKLIEEEEE